MKGVIIGAPPRYHRTTLCILRKVYYAKLISQRTGAGFLIGSGFASKRLPVSQPLVRWTPSAVGSNDPLERGSIYREFKALLRQTSKGNVKLYIGVRSAVGTTPSDRIEVATSGFTFEQLAILKESFVRIRDSALSGSSIPKIAIAIEALEKISWRVSGVKHHGVLMFAERGLNLRLPEILSTAATEPTYTTILTAWTEEIFALFQDNSSQPETVVKLTDYSRIESLWSRKRQNGIVIGAPHGTFDEHTAEMANEVSHRTGIAAVIARAFTPTECGDGASTSIAPPSDSIRRTVSKSVPSGRKMSIKFSNKAYWKLHAAT